MTIRSYRNDLTRDVASGATPKGFPVDLCRRAVRKLTMIKYAERLTDLRSPPGNRLEALKSNRKGQFSIRINDQYRLCFRWTNEGPTDVEIVDDH